MSSVGLVGSVVLVELVGRVAGMGTGKMYKNKFNIGNHHLYEVNHKRAVEMRKAPTEAEAVMWEALRAGRMGVKFRRQQTIGQYIVDFFCLEKKIVVEIDGGIHQDAKQAVWDRQRDMWLLNNAYTVIRVTNEEVMTDVEGVKRKIAEAIEELGREFEVEDE